jgi:hypothetical protein
MPTHWDAYVGLLLAATLGTTQAPVTFVYEPAFA